MESSSCKLLECLPCVRPISHAKNRRAYDTLFNLRGGLPLGMAMAKPRQRRS